MGTPLSHVYALAIGRINRRYDAGRGVVRFDRPVISVGNLSAGGTGKTPMVARIVRMLRAAGHRPCIAMRGYKGGGGSDEAAAYGREFPGLPIVAQADRTHGLIELFHAEHEGEAPHTDCIVLDDGFQHRRIGRELDIVLIDSTRSVFADRLLPAGWLREPVSSLRRAGAVVITHAEASQPTELRTLEAQIAGIRGRGPEAIARHEWSGLSVWAGGADHEETAAWLRGKRAFAVCAIGNPGPFLDAATKAVGGTLAGAMVLRDHDPYGSSTLVRVLHEATSSGAQVVLTTEKDWSKLARVAAGQWPCPVARPRLELGFDRGGSELDALVLETVRRGVPEDEAEPPAAESS